MRAGLEKILADGRDSPMLRLSLGQACLRDGDREDAIAHLRAAVEQDPGYSAAWKVLGKALAEGGWVERAIEAYDQGITIARQQGDLQAAKEMEVFRRRLQR